MIAGDQAPSPAEAAAATYGQSRPIPPNRLTGQTAAAATFVRLDVSALAVQQKVFENLLSRHELGNDQDSRNVARNAPADGSNLRSNQLEQGGQGGILGLNRQAKMAANGSLGSQLTASGSASSEGFNQQQVVSKSAPPASLNYEFRAPTIDSNIQAPAAATSPQHGMDVKAPPYQSDTAKDVRQQVPRHVIYYEFDASPEQLAVIIKQIGERSDSFSAPEIESAVSASPGASSLAQNDIYGGNNSAGRFAGRGYGGGGLTDGSVQQQQAMAVGGRANLSLKESAQPQTVQAAASGTAHPATAPAAGTAKQHVVFLLNVVDHLAPIAGRASQLPANAVPAPAKQ